MTEWIPTRQYAHDLYGSRLTDAQCEALDAALEEPWRVHLLKAVAHALGADPDRIPRVMAVTREQVHAEAIIVTWVDGIVMPEQEDPDLLEMMRY